MKNKIPVINIQLTKKEIFPVKRKLKTRWYITYGFDGLPANRNIIVKHMIICKEILSNIDKVEQILNK